jgi:hypothetical protein
MDIRELLNAEIPPVVERVRLPSPLVVGRFNAAGERDEAGNVFISPIGHGISNVWAVFSQALAPRQRGEMILENLPGTKVINGVVSEWIPGAPGEWGPGFGDDKLSKLNIPFMGLAVVAGIGLQRGEGVMKVIALNTYEAAVNAAAGIIIPVST